MKKLLMFLCCAFALNANVAWGGCKLSNCERNGDFINGWIFADTGNKQCWWCGPGFNSCGNGDVVTYKDEVGDAIELKQCSIGFSNKFVTFEPNILCKNSQLYSEDGISDLDTTNAKKTFDVTNQSKTRASEFGDWYISDGKAACVYYKCKRGYVPAADKRSCILQGQYDCNKGGGEWENGKCDCSKHGSDYVWNGKECTKTQEAIKRDEQQQQQRQRQQQQQSAAKKACIESGGEWVNNACACRAEKNIVLSNGKCECKNVDFKFESAAVGCVEKDEAVRRRACEAASETGAYWNGTACLCNGTDMVFAGGRCQKSADAAACEAAGDTVWNSVTKVCNCKKGGYEWTGEKCEESMKSIQAREEAARRQRVTQSSAAIENASKKLDDIMAGLKISAWKTSEGNFNGARLASDSIAGVVLGTAGGLITSNVVKKNQVKSGFEDVSCTVGGQRVADWGDEFTVGIR